MAYLIGMHEFIDVGKFQRDHYGQIAGIEFCNFPLYRDAEDAVAFAKSSGTHFAVHFPLCRESYKYRDPHVTSQDEMEQEIAFEAIARECDFAKKHGALYLLMHFPKPIILPRAGNFDAINIPNHEFVYDDCVNYDSFALQCERAFRYLNNLSIHYDIPIVLELDLMMHWLYETSLLEVLLVKYPNVKLCIDLARCHVQKTMDKRFNHLDFIRRYSPFTYVAHVSNIRVTNQLHERHYPAIENYYDGEGWGNLTPMLEAFLTKPKHVLFEHKSSHLTQEELDNCYKYVMRYL